MVTKNNKNNQSERKKSHNFRKGNRNVSTFYDARINAHKLSKIKHLYDVATILEEDLPLDFCSECNLQEKHCQCVYEVHSGLENVGKMPKSVKSQTVAFSDTVGDYTHDYTVNEDPTRKLMDQSDDALQDFFSRPIKIYSSDWSTSTTFSDNFDPWGSYFENLRVVNRISNFNLMRAKLHVKFVINGNAFHYGRILASYLPFDIYDTLSTFAALVPEDAVQESQCPHVFLDPTTSTGGTLMLPFFNYYNSINIPQSQWNEMGKIYMRSLNSLKHANGATDVAKVSVFAWAEGVTLTIPTSDEPSELAPQSGRESEMDEANKNGVISGPATAVSKVASALSTIPPIAPFAKATELGASVVAKVAKELGYCAPPVTRDPAPYKPVPNSSLALTNVPQQLQRMTVDDKQELTIDPTISGIDNRDPLKISSIAQRESYLTTFNWPIGTASESLLWNARVDPGLWAESGATAYHFPALAMATMPFKYWTGTLKFRFQIVCSAYHKGRLKFVYDPNYMKSNEYNVNYMEIVDLADKNDFTMTIGAAQATTLMQTSKPTDTTLAVSDLYGTGALSSSIYGNGVLSIYVVNELTTPNSTVNNDIQINVFVSAGDDFEVFVPTDDYQFFVFKPQSGVEETGTDGDNAEIDAPEQDESTNIGTDLTNTSDLTNLVFTGESISSFRTLLKRFNLHSTMFQFPTVSNRLIYGRRPAFPYLRGNVSGAVNTTGALAPYSYCNTVLLHWVTMAFSGWRGSIRWKLLARGRIEDSNFQLYVQRSPQGLSTGYDQGVAFAPNYGSQSIAAHSAVVDPLLGVPANLKPLAGPNGVVFQQGRVNPTCEFECPYYSLWRFSPGKTQDFTSTCTFNETWDYRAFVEGDTSTTLDAYCAAGEDFQTFFFTGLPRMYREMSPPAP